jgi:hypothetical protein
MNATRTAWHRCLLAAVGVVFGVTALPTPARAIVSPYSLTPFVSVPENTTPPTQSPPLVVKPPSNPPSYQTDQPPGSGGKSPGSPPPSKGVPEPASAVSGLLGSLLIGLAALRRRKK